ncbi:MAG TPA: hypothetical protein VFZ34_16035, partial [Blastocatellia bacterium]|nr:hypothetical protein [Blastocatellia bacterium]
MWLALFLSCLLNYGVLQKALDSFRMEVRTAFFCDFVKTPDEYADKVIRIRVAYHTNEHGA